MNSLSLIFIIACASVVTRAQDGAKPPNSSAPQSPQQLRIVEQPEAPVRISSARVKWAIPGEKRGVEVYIAVENVGTKAVRTYETRRDLDSTTGPKTCLGPGRIPGGLLRPGQTAGTSTWQGVFNADPAPAVWIDFVEFADGTTWGVDDCHMAEKLDGSRTGVRMEREQLLTILHEQGAEALMEFIHKNFKQMFDPNTYVYLLDAVAAGRVEKPLLPIWPPFGHARDWEVAFLSGAASTVQQVIEAYQTWGADEIEHVLTRPLVRADR